MIVPPIEVEFFAVTLLASSPLYPIIILPEFTPSVSAVNVAFCPIEPPAIWIAPFLVSTSKSLDTFESFIKNIAFFLLSEPFIFGFNLPAVAFKVPSIVESFIWTSSPEFTVKFFDLKSEIYAVEVTEPFGACDVNPVVTVASFPTSTCSNDAFKFVSTSKLPSTFVFIDGSVTPQFVYNLFAFTVKFWPIWLLSTFTWPLALIFKSLLTSLFIILAWLPATTEREPSTVLSLTKVDAPFVVIFACFAVKLAPVITKLLLSVTKLIVPSPLVDVIDEFAIWIEELLLNVTLFVFVESADACIKLEPSFVTNEILLPVILEAFTSIPFAIILRSPPEKTLPEFNAITLYVLSLNAASLKLIFNLPLSKVHLLTKSWVVNTKVPAVEIEPPPVINIPFGLDIIIAPWPPEILPAIVDIPLRTLFKTAQLPLIKFKDWSFPTFKNPQSRTASPLNLRFAVLLSGFTTPVKPPCESLIWAPPEPLSGRTGITDSANVVCKVIKDKHNALAMSFLKILFFM